MRVRLFLALAPLTISGPAPRPKPPTASAPYAIAALHAQLYYDDSGTFSNDLLAARDTLPVVFNILNSQATLVSVEVMGPATYAGSRLNVEVAIRSSGKEILRRQQHMPAANPQGRRFVAFWVYDTGCHPLEISAALIGQMDPSRHRDVLPFHCGE